METPKIASVAAALRAAADRMEPNGFPDIARVHRQFADFCVSGNVTDPIQALSVAMGLLQIALDAAGLAFDDLEAILKRQGRVQ